MLSTKGFIPDAWAVTDLFGRIETMSPMTRDILRTAHLGYGDNLVHFFSSYRKAVLFDMEVALTGWPTKRTVELNRMSANPLSVCYQVSRRIDPEGVGLFWRLDVVLAQNHARCA